MFPALQNLNPKKNTEEWKRAYTEACLHIPFCCELYREQIDRGGYILHEHPVTATSWKLPCVQEIMSMAGMRKVWADQCQFGLSSKEGGRMGPAKKPTYFMTNSPYLAEALSRRCQGGHKHVILLDRRAGPAAEYPEGLCRAINLSLIHI